MKLPGVMRSKAFIQGAMIGCLLAILVYIISLSTSVIFPSAPSMTLSRRYQYTDVIKNVDSIYAESVEIIDALSSRFLLGPSHTTASINQVVPISDRELEKHLLVIVLSSYRNLPAVASLISSTWGRDVEHYKLAIGGLKSNPEMANMLLHAKKCTEFQPEPSPENLFCLLEAIYTSYIDQFDWFLIVSESVYIVGQRLKQFLTNYDSQGVLYIGRPSTLESGHHCDGGPGILLSNKALKMVRPHLDSCLSELEEVDLGGRESGGGGREEESSTADGGGGDVQLGRCFSQKLEKTCLSFDKASNYFIEDKTGISLKPDKLWYNKAFKEMITLYPILDASHMCMIHLYNNVREMNYYRNKASSLYERLASDPDPAFVNISRKGLIPTIGMENVNSNLEVQATPPVESKNIVVWETFNNFVYNGENMVPAVHINAAGDLKKEIHYITDKALEVVNSEEISKTGISLSLHSVPNGYLRYRDSKGREYILDMVLDDRVGQRQVQRRVSLVRAHQPELIVHSDASTDDFSKTVNFIVPLIVGQDSVQLEEFLAVYEGLCLRTQENCKLVLVVYAEREVDRDGVTYALARYKLQHFRFNYRVLVGEGKFSRGRAMDLGMRSLDPSELAFLCDLDVTVEEGFLNRCRLNALQGQRVYSPQIFQYYNMDYVYRFRRKPVFGFDISRKHGHWETNSYDMLCIYHSDYITTGGFDNVKEKGWHEEGLQLVDRILAAKLDVLRAPDPSLRRHYSDNKCTSSLGKEQLARCLSSQNENLADRTNLADYVFYLEEMCGVAKRTLWGW